MKPAQRRAKGHAFERQVAKDMREFYPEAKRGFQTRGGGKEQADVIGTPFQLECKHHAEPTWRTGLDALEQARKDGHGKAGLPVAVVKGNRQKPMVYISAVDLVHRFLEDEMLDQVVALPYSDFLSLVRANNVDTEAGPHGYGLVPEEEWEE